MATLQGKAVKNTYRQVLQIGANNVGVSGTLQPVQDGAGVNTALSLSTTAATVNGDLTITGDLIITGGGIQIKDLIDDTVADLIQNGTGITWTYNDGAATLTGNFTGTTSVVPEGSNLYYTQGRFDSAFAAKSTTNLAEGTNLYFTTARGNANFATNLAASDTDDLDEGVTNLYYTEARDTSNFNSNLATKDTDDLTEGSTNLYYTNARSRNALSVTAGTGIDYNSTTGNFNLGSIPNASLTNSSITVNGISAALGASISLTTSDIAEGTNLYWTNARFDSRFGTKTTTDLAEGTNLYYTQARFNTAFDAKTTTDLDEGTNLYYTDARSRAAISESAVGLDYSSASGVLSLTSGYAIPTTVKLGEYDTAYNRSIVSAGVTGTSTKTLSLTQQDANVITATWTDQGITTINGTANQIAANTVGNTTTVGFTNDVTFPNNVVVSGNLTINGTATYVNTEAISSKDPLFEVANTNNTTDAVDIGYYGRYYDSVQERVEFTGLFRDASDAGKFKIFNGLVDEPTNVVNTTGTGYTVATLVANVDGNLAGTANAANVLSTARTISATGDAAWSVSFDGSANVTAALTLANTGVTASTYGTTTAVPTIAIDSKGRITSASNTNIAFPVTTVNGQAGTVVLTTSDVAEGSNQYFTSARAQAAISGTAPISVSSGVVSISQSSAINNGYLSSTDWNTFNDKLSTATAASTYVPYTGATGSVNLGTYTLSAAQVRATSSAGLSINANGGTQIANLGAGGGANMTLYGGLTGTTGSFESSGSGGTFAINHTSGSGVATTITKAGNGEALVINKTSGSGNALSVTGSTSLGALTGSTATFSGAVELGGGQLIRWGLDDGSANARAWGIRNGYNASGDLVFLSSSTNNTTLNTVQLQIARSGAATFSSSVAVNGSTVLDQGLSVQYNQAKTYTTQVAVSRWHSNESTGSQFKLNLFAKGNATTSLRYFAFQTSNEGVADDGVLALQPVGGNVLIGKTNDVGGPLQVSNGSNMLNFVWDVNGAILSSVNNANTTYKGMQFDALDYRFFTSSGTADFSISSTGAATFSGAFLEMGGSGVSAPPAGLSYGLFPQSSIGLGLSSLYGMTFWTGTTPAERMRITSGGYVKASNTGSYNNPTGNQHEFNQSLGGNATMVVRNFGSTNGSGIICYTPSADTSEYFFSGISAGTTRISIYTNGNIQNYNNSYGALSDIKLKENITDASPKLADLLKVKIRNYNLIGDETKQIGVIAQELQEIFPSLIDETEDKIKDEETGETINLGTTTKSVKYSVFVPMLIKAIQELEARVKELEAK